MVSDFTVQEKRQFRAIKGVRDILPPESAAWNRVEQTAREVFEAYGYGEIRLPTFELARLFERGVGDETDIITKEFYFWIDSPRANQALRRVRGKTIRATYRAIHDDPAVQKELLSQIEKGAFDKLAEANRICLRPEATASVVRAYIEHGMKEWPDPVKLYYIGPMFRRERPQKGRYRQFYQIGAEVLGQSDSPAIDAELIEMLLQFFSRIGLMGCKLYYNSIGCRQCRSKYVAELKAALEKVRDKLGAYSQRRIETNPLRVLDSKVESEQAVIEKLPRISDYLCEACREHFAALKQQFTMRGIEGVENWRLVRGLDYYTRTTFEITAPGLGSQNAVCGGGRYDGLVELLGGPPTKGIGFAIGTDRVMLSLQDASAEESFVQQVTQFPDALVVGTTTSTWPKAIEIASALRRHGLRVYLPEAGTRLKKAMELANRIRIRVAIIVGEDELQHHQLAIRVLQPFDERQPKDSRIDQSLVINYGRLVRFRAELERRLRNLGHFGKNLGIAQMVEALSARGFLDRRLSNELRNFSTMANALLHGVNLTPGSLEATLVRGPLLLDEIDRIGAPTDQI